ncbi:hypothetical protein Pelo_17687 [Pelomyxa schiedti]|nr:hypothetical protein Pelo_17687 [Pelomyxa schiedti]
MGNHLTAQSRSQDPLPVVTVALRARDQCLALATSTQPRCGARSPPRVLTPPLLALVWDLCSIERRFVIPVVTGDLNQNLMYYVGVSPLLLSVSPRGVVANLETHAPPPNWWVDADHHVSVQTFLPDGGYGFVLKDRSAEEDDGRGDPKGDAVTGIDHKYVFGPGHSRGVGVDVLRLEYVKGPTWDHDGSYYCNKKWWCGLNLSRNWMCLQSLVAPKVKDHQQPQQQPSILAEPKSVIFAVAVNPESVDFLGMGKSNPNELLVVLRPNLAEAGAHEKRILLVDAQQTFSSGNLSVVCSVARTFPAGRVREGFILIKRTGVLVCVLQVLVPNPSGPPTQIFVVEMKYSGTVMQLKGGCGLSRVSDSIFCLSYQKTQCYELWDCNDTGKPIRVVQDTLFAAGSENTLLFAFYDLNTWCHHRHCEEVEEPLPVVTVTLRARDQFLALATSAHPRCGTRSPARALTPPLLRLLWDLCVAATERRFVIPVGTTRNTSHQQLVHRAGVSPLLLSVTPRGVSATLEPFVPPHRRPDADHWAGPNPEGGGGCVLMRRRVTGGGGAGSGGKEPGGRVGNTRETLGVDVVMRLEFVREWGIRGSYYCNRKWWCGLSADRECMFLQSIVVPVVKNQNGSLPIPWCVMIAAAVKPESAEFLGMGKSNPDEFLLVIRPSLRGLGTQDKTLLVADAQQTFSSGNLAVVCSLVSNFPAGEIREGFLLFKKTGTRVCVIQVWVPNPGAATAPPNKIFVVEMRPSGTVKQMDGGYCCEVSRLSDSLFCISHKGLRSELWDCNDTEQPMRVVADTLLTAGVWLPGSNRQ